MTDILLYIIRYRHLKRLLLMVAMFIVHCSTFNVYAQITIGGNVYGGGNAGDVNGSTAVTVRAGDLNAVFGGARMANVNGNALVNIDGANASNYILINYVYGGNDIAGTISTGGTVPAVVQADATANNVDNTWNAFVRVSTKTEMVNGKEEEVDDAQKIYIGQLFGGGNGDYDYTSDDSPYKGMAQPEVDRAFLDIRGGSIVYAYGGGNNATVTDKTVIYVDNPSKVVNSIKVTDGVIDETNGTELLTPSRLKDDMGINTTFSSPTSDAFQIGRFFGGNNKAEMAIRPVWNLQRGLIRNIYSGGNRGAMTYPQGILLQIKSDQIKVDNVFGGCRMADVNPAQNKIMRERIDGVDYPEGYAARVYITGGDINNVYGGNDISGNVYGGNAVGIHASIKGSVYGGGNGSYPYTDNASLKDNEIYGDLYYGDFWTAGGYASSVKALNAFRPNAEAVSIRIGGTDEAHPTIVGGAIYCGGNSATLSSTLGTDKAQLKIGSYVIADSVFLGNNGKDMIKFNEKVVETNGNILVQEGVLRTYAKFVKADGTLVDIEQSGATKFNSMDLTDKDTFGEYMDGCAMRLEPNVVFDNKKRYGDPVDYEDYSTYFGSFYCGGNVGSMKFNDVITIDFEHKVVIYDQLVGGCNDAFVKTSDFNAAYEGGVLGNKDTHGNKLIMNLSGLKIEPKRWKLEQNEGQYVTDSEGHYIQYLDPLTHLPKLEWNTIDADGNPTPPIESGAGGEASDDDMARRLIGGNVYGGCCKSGVVDGNVIINLNATLIEREKLFDEVESEEEGDEVSLYGENQTTETSYTITRRHTGVLLGEQGMDAFGKALNVFGGGKGAGTQIWGSTTVNLNTGYTFQIFGGSEEGAIGKPVTNGNYSFTYKLDENSATSYTDKYSYNADYSCYVNLKGAHPGVSMTSEDNSPDMAECEFIYGGGFLGPIAGNTVINLGKGRIFNSFAGSCNADILGHTETYIGRQVITDEDGYPTGVEEGFPWIRDYVYGGNDFGGSIYGGSTNKESVVSFSDRVREGTSDKVHSDDVLKASAYVEYTQGRTLGIFGGCYGTYNYTDDRYNAYSSKDDFTKPFMDNAFVNFRPTLTEPLKNNRKNVVGRIYGAGQGYPGDMDSDKMQNRSYVLIDIPQEMENYKKLEAFGAGAWSGLGLGRFVTPAADSETYRANADKVSAIIDLIHGQVGAAYGGAYQDGVTRRTVVNVPVGSTITIGSIFGGAYGVGTYNPCDVYEANVNYSSEEARLINDPNSDPENYKLYRGAIYGGNNNKRRTLYGRVNINSEVKMDMVKDGQVILTQGTVYGAGYGADSWSEYTEVNLNNGAKVYEVYGGGQAGKVYNAESVQNFINKYKPEKWPDDYPIAVKRGKKFSNDDWKDAWTIGGGYDLADDVWKGPWKLDGSKEYWENTNTNLANPLVREAEMDDRDFSGLSDADKALVQNKYSTNVIINKGATVVNYAYGGGLGADALVSGTTYITLLGGTVVKDIYAAGTSGSVEDRHGAGVYGDGNRAGFVASANAYIQGGTVRNVYGGGWRGSVGHHAGFVSNVATTEAPDIDGESHVVIGNPDPSKNTHINGVPSITRNVYGGGEGGTIFGDAYVTINKGYIGFRYMNTAEEGQTPKYEYVPELIDGTQSLDKGGNVFGGGYVANSYVDRSHVTMWDGIVRGCLYGGGEIGPIGRGTVHADSLELEHIRPSIKHSYAEKPAAIYKEGKTEVCLYGGHVMRDVFGGGRGFDNWGGEGYMTPDEVLTMDRSSKGYVFGSTEVHIRGGEIGTPENVLRGYGNVFGGGNEGFVYSGKGQKVGVKQKSDLLDSNGMPTGGGGFYYEGGVVAQDKLTTDCRVDVEPYCKVTADGGISGFTAKDLPNVKVKSSYSKGEYVPVEALNQLQSRNHTDAVALWAKLDTRGVTIHNALFAGGNITEGSDIVTANTITVYGNTAASLRDAYNFDLISLGTEDMGGLYGDGNLTLVDGFREVHIDNYGTDYYSLAETMELDDYEELTERQKAYYKLKYVPVEPVSHTYTYWESKKQHTVANTTTAYRRGQKITQAEYDALASYPGEQANWTWGTKTYQKDDQIEEGEWLLMDAGEQAKWKLHGVTSIYAGRPMNTIQRADMCGVFGSRLVLRGAEDRAILPGLDLDNQSYTINRVDEVSLNKNVSQAQGDEADELDKEHGNYFGIYNSVKFLGNLTSDVSFSAVRETKETESEDPNYVDPNHADGTTTYYEWKGDRPYLKNRNNGTSHNKVALASGVYLEIKREEGELTGKDDWGYITGVIELDLINVMPGMGGGYVYAQNVHGAPQSIALPGKVTLLDYNRTATTYRSFKYSGELQPIETSGNFVHYKKEIVDDCFPNGGVYNDGYVESPAHYWYIRGSIYVYEQYITAYTGAANATAQKKEIPLTITAASNGKMTLREVQPNYYAFFDKNNNKLGDPTPGVNADTVFVANNKSYRLNEAISYWDYQLLDEGDRAKFVPETYIVIDSCKVDGRLFVKGYVLLPEEYDELKRTSQTVEIWGKNEQGQDVKIEDSTFDEMFRLSNNLGHDKGYILTYDVNNPGVWNNYYTKTTSPGQANALTTMQYTDGINNQTISRTDYTEGPTYTLNGNSAGVFGQQKYRRGSIIFGSVVTNYNNEIINHLGTNAPPQATVERAWVVIQEHSVKDADGNEVQHLNVGTPIYRSKYTEDQWAEISRVAEEAKVCTSLLEFTSTDYVYAGQLLSSEDIAVMKSKVKAQNSSWTDSETETFVNQFLDDAYYCKTPDGYDEAYYGGTYFQPGYAYNALDTWCSMTKEEREANFTFNYDALDLLIDTHYSGQLGLYDGTLNPKVYSVSQPIDYEAEYTENTACKYKDENDVTVTYTKDSRWLTREEYEDIPNEKRYYTPIVVSDPNKTYYMVNSTFRRGDIPYTIGQQINEDTYQSLNEIERRDYIDKFIFTPEQAGTQNQDGTYTSKTYYYCRQTYTINEKGEGMDVTTVAVNKNGTNVESKEYKSTNPSVPQGAVITDPTYESLKNFQTGFIIHGTSPTEVSTLYVSNESDINDLRAEKIITVIYNYEYDESDETGLNVTPVSERHVLNIHIKFESGVPEIGDINKPSIVLPGTTIGMNIPSVTPGAYKVTDAGWELFSNQDDADTHTNGTTFVNNETKLYWYQNDYRIAYWALTKLGKTYSKSVPISVANYHDLKKVMDDKEHHYYIDHQHVDYEPKIYINDYTTSDPTTSQNGLDLLKNLIDLSFIPKTYTEPDEHGRTQPKPISDGVLEGHIPLERTGADQTTKPMRGGKYLEFFMRTDIDHGPTPDPEHEGQTIEHPWTPIANGENECFEGVLHGDGHTISGLAPAEGTTGSLFGKLCGSVYNLGVTGSFTGGGIADTGGGYMENCWIKTTGSVSGVHPLFGEPTDTEFSQVVNCYYLEDGETALYIPFSNNKNTATKKSTRSFYNGEVTYDLNGFYLYKRYSDKQSGTSDTDYKYWTSGETNPQTGYYASNPTLCSSGYRGGKYVEDRYADGDFIYAGGSIPESYDDRLVKDADGKPVLDEDGRLVYYPKWPDDYYFFGQILDYGYGDNPKHQDVPSTFTALNRVYRAPAYFRNSEMRAAYFNANAVFAEHKKDDETVEAYRDMTAIDFTGGNRDVDGGYKLADLDQSGKFYPPLLDDGGLTGFSNEDLTRNLLVYTSTIAPASSATNTVVSGVLTDEAYADAETDTDHPGYHNMADRRSFGKEISGHWVEQVITVSDGEEVKTYQAIRDHYLVDKQDFYAPIGYTFVAGTGEAEAHRMWYQREPENYVGQLKDDNGNYLTNTGWEGVSLPFKAEIVTTNQKGEITHFYSKSWENANNSDAKIGHEYWLREFEGGSVSTENPTVFVGTFNRPTANSADREKEYENTFLWDYYYSYNHYDDLNSDDYQEEDPTHTYYKEPRTYTDYPRLANGTPYIIGFPGERYYEFDLSGQFKAETALSMPTQLGRQVITFASKKGAMIAASDREKGKSVTEGNNTYTFQTNYLKRTFKPGTAKTYTLKADGSSYDLVPAASNAPEVTVDPVTVDAFRPYFTVEAANNNVNGVRTRSIIFSEDDAQLKGKDDRPKQEEIGGTLDIYAKRHKIIVESSLDHSTDVRIVNTAGITVSSFTIEPGETVETRIINIGVYIVQSADGIHIKKLAVR